jgi:elongation factor P hydroxylase
VHTNNLNPFGRKFRVSLDNLTGDSGDGKLFKDNVYAQVQRYFSGEAKLPITAITCKVIE